MHHFLNCEEQKLEDTQTSKNFFSETQQVKLKMDGRVPEEVQKQFKKLQGRVFHTIKTVGGTNYLHRYRIGSDGNINFEEQLQGLYLTSKDVQKIIKEAGNEVWDLLKCITRKHNFCNSRL